MNVSGVLFCHKFVNVWVFGPCSASCRTCCSAPNPQQHVSCSKAHVLYPLQVEESDNSILQLADSGRSLRWIQALDSQISTPFALEGQQ